MLKIHIQNVFLQEEPECGRQLTRLWSVLLLSRRAESSAAAKGETDEESRHLLPPVGGGPA